VPVNQYFAVGFGNNMTNADIIIWQAYSDYPVISDCFSTKRGKPVNDKRSDDYQTTYYINTTHIKFESTRYFGTGDPQDIAIEYVIFQKFKEFNIFI
jgi:hypothetical protein